jgi:hypothetical protein
MNDFPRKISLVNPGSGANFSRQENICPIFIRICFPRFHSGEPRSSVEFFRHGRKVSWDFVVQLKIDQKFSFPAFNLFDGGCSHFH